MSWYLFRDEAAVKLRGIKVDGFYPSPLHRPTINLSWGMNAQPPYSKNRNLPTTIQNSILQQQKDPITKTKVLTQTSEEDGEQLIKLIKHRETNRKGGLQQEIITKVRGQNLHSKEQASQQRQQKNQDFSKRVRYLENSLLPYCRRDSMATIFDYSLSQQVPLSDSRLSNRSTNKKNQSKVVLGDGFNAFSPQQQPKKDFTQQLQEMYEYEERRNKRAALGSFVLN